MRPPKDLLDKWYKKLEDEGFEDIERDEYSLKEYHSSYFRNKHKQGSFEQKQRYYELAAQLLHSFPFTSTASKAIWRLHCTGMSVLAIAKELKLSDKVVARSIDITSGHIKYENHEND